jgi:hypothetical protein
MMAPVRSGSDPLELARQQLDFAAIAAGAPSSKEVLFKAQTMVPISAPRPWRQTATVIAVLALIIGLAVVPWLPQRSSLALLTVGFEQRFERPEAQEVVSHFVREMPGNVLSGVDYDDGRLSLRLSSFSRSSGELKEAVDGIVKDYPGSAGSYQVRAGQVDLTRFASPYAAIARLVIGESYSQHASGLGGELAEEVLANVDVLAEGVARQFKRVGRELVSFEFIVPGAVDEQLERYSFTVDSWPCAAGVVVRQYEDLRVLEQEDLQERAETFLTAANLSNAVSGLTDVPQPWLPVLVEVRDGRRLADETGHPPRDPRLTQRLQAWIDQPTAAELRSIDFEPRECVEAALEHVLPAHECRLDQERVGKSAADVPLYRVVVTVTGALLHPRGELTHAEVEVEDDLEY